MIKKLKISGVATFTDASKATVFPSRINFCYGGNGSGKTTISKVIADAQENEDMIEWEGTPTRTLVYNKDFVISNFGLTSRIEGIFTLGKESKETLEYIDKYKEEIEKCLD